MKWYRATKVSNNDYKVTIPLSDYKNAKGNYITHSYINTTEGKMFSYAANNYTYGVNGVIPTPKPAPAKPVVPTNTAVTVLLSASTDKLGVVVGSGADTNMYQGNPPLTANSGKVVAKTSSRAGQTFRVLRESTLSNRKTYLYGLFGDKQYYWISSDSLTNVQITSSVKSDQVLTTKLYATIKNNVQDIRKDDPRYRVAGQYRTYNDIINSNSAKSANVQLTHKTVYSNGEVWYEFTQSNKNGHPMGWVKSDYLINIK